MLTDLTGVLVGGEKYEEGGGRWWSSGEVAVIETECGGGFHVKEKGSCWVFSFEK